MRHSVTRLIGASVTVLTLALVGPARAQAGPPEPGLSLGFGIGFAPDFVGSDDDLPVPLPSVEYRGDRINLRSNGLGLETALFERGGVSAGAIARLDPGRNDLFNAEDKVVRRLRRISASPEVGGYVEFARPYEAFGGGVLVARTSVVRGVLGGHGGALVEASAGTLRTVGPWTLGVFATMNVQDRRYAQAFFGVTAADAAASGLARYRAGGGVRDLGASGFVSRPVSKRLSVSATMAYSRLRGDAADSPIVTVRGRRDQVFSGLAFTWRFGGGA